MKRFISVILTITILFTTLLISPIASYAATPVELEDSSLGFWADPENVLSQDAISNFSSNKLSTLGGVKPYKITTSLLSVRKYYLFLPSNADCTALKLWFTGSLTIDNKSITSGVPTDVFKDINEGGVSKSYYIRQSALNYVELVVIKSGDVGTVYIDTESGSMKNICGSKDHSVEESGSVMVVQPDGTVDYSGVLDKIAGHGNGSWSTNYDKLAYNIKLASSTSLLGMGKAKKWILLANKNDQTLVKNRITYDFARLIGIEYEPYVKPVDLYVNQQYFGSYLLCEKVELKSNRVGLNSDSYENLQIANGNIDSTTGKLIPADLTGTEIYNDNVGKGDTQGGKRYAPSLKDPSDVTGGYLFELDIAERWIKDGTGFSGYNRQGWSVKNCDYASRGMVDYCYDLMFALGSAVYNNGTVPSEALTEKYDFGDTENPAPNEKYQGKRWDELLDRESAIKYYWVMEYFKNMDSSLSSTYFYKESDSIDSKLYAGPVWDMDWSICYGKNSSRWGYSYCSTDGWYTKNTGMFEYSMSKTSTSYKADVEVPRSFYGALASNCSDFWLDAERYWKSYIDDYIDILLGNKIDETGTLKSVKDYVYELKKSGTMNNIRFDINSGSYSRTDIVNGLTGWLSERRTWINKEIAVFDISNAEINSIDSCSYNGNEILIKPNLTYSFSEVGIKELIENVDYILDYENNINAGTAKVTIKGIGAFSGYFVRDFEIEKANLKKFNVEIPTKSYTNTKIEAKVFSNDSELTNSISYQWYRNNMPIENENESFYVISESDVNSVISVKAIGDGINVDNSKFSNECVVKEGERPEGYTQCLAKWEYIYPEEINSISEQGYVYQANFGKIMYISTLNTSVNSVDNAKLKWSGTTDIYKNQTPDNTESQAPVISTSKTDGLAWGEYPYFEIQTSTVGYDNLSFSASLGGSKKAPRAWELSYSIDGINFKIIDNSKYTISSNKVLERAFNEFKLPIECNNQNNLIIRITACEDRNIANDGGIINVLGGDAAINNVELLGSSMEIVNSLYAPSFNHENGSCLYNDSTIEILDNNGGADLYYSINGSHPIRYEHAFTLFDKTNIIGDSIEVTAFARFNDVTSEVATRVYYFAGCNIQSFCYNEQPDEVFNATVQSTGGIYGKSGRMTAVADVKHQYVPLWNEKSKCFSVSPDDGAKWCDTSGFTYLVSTAGFKRLSVSLDAFTTASGPNSISLQYSLNGVDYYNIKTNVKLNSELTKTFDFVELPEACNNKSLVFIRLATTENMTNSGDKLHNNLSKGNFYVNNFVLSGENDGTIKMPFTDKSTNYFGTNGTIKYISPDELPISYAVFDENNYVVMSGVMDEEGIKLCDSQFFNPKAQEKYTVFTWVEEDEDMSIINSNCYYYKGNTVVKFNYNSSSRPFENYVSSDFLSIANTSGASDGNLSVYPNGEQPAELSFSSTYGIKTSWSEANPFVSSKNLDNPNNNGFWLIETSTLGFTDLTINLEQISSNNGPRDWALAYSFDNNSYTFIENSNIRTVSNDNRISTIESYNNFKLPNECDNKDKIFLKLFINGGESVNGTELEDVQKGNTGINNIEINGIPIPNKYSLTVKTVNQIDKFGNTNDEIVASNISINGNMYQLTNGELNIDVTEGKRYLIKASSSDTFVKEINYVPIDNNDLLIPVVTIDYISDGIINAKDYAFIINNFNGDEKNKKLNIFNELVNLKA